MHTDVDEIAPDTFRLSTFIPDVGPTGMTFNQFLIVDEQPLLFHTGHRQLFPLVSEAIGTIMPLDRLRWIAFGHVEADECGSMNQFLAAAPDARGRPRRTGLHGVAERHGRSAAGPARGRPGARTGPSTACDTSTPLTCRTLGRPA